MGDTAAFIRAAITVYWGSEVEQGEGSLKREVMVQDEKTEEGVYRMKKIWVILSIVFSALAIVGAVYVLTTDGMANAGYAVVPMVIGLSCLTVYRTRH